MAVPCVEHVERRTYCFFKGVCISLHLIATVLNLVMQYILGEGEGVLVYATLAVAHGCTFPFLVSCTIHLIAVFLMHGWVGRHTNFLSRFNQ